MMAIRFFGPVQAFLWAQEVAERPGIKSPTQLAIDAMVQDRSKGGELTREDVLDCAHTVLAQVKRIEPGVAQQAFRVGLSHVPERDAHLQSELASRISEEHPRAGYGRCSQIAATAIVRLRAAQMHQRELPFSIFAQAMGVRRQSAQHWRGQIEATEALLWNWFVTGKRKCRQLLDEAGAIAGEPDSLSRRA